MALPIRRVVQHLREVALLHDGGELTDGELLDCFIAHGDESAFGALVCRHGPMVLGVCRRIVGNVPEAEDAFQATFLVLVRKAASVKPREQVGSWLHGVAYRTAKKARAIQKRRHARETELVDMPRPETQPAFVWDEVRAVLDEEVNHLPEKYRAPFVLCDLVGRTRREAAVVLRLQEGALAYRLTTARALLAQRLTRRGVTLSGGGLAMILGQSQVTAAVTASLAGTAVRVVTIDVVGAVAGTVPVPIVGLAEGVLQAMFVTKLKVAAAVLLTLAVAGGGMRMMVPNGAEGQALAQQDNDPRGNQDAGQGKDPGKASAKADPNQTLEQKLNAPLSLKFEGTKLSEALDFIVDKTSINVFVEPQAQERLGNPLTMRLIDVPLRTSLKLMLRGTELGFVVEDGVVVIGSAKTQEKFVLKSYPVGDLVNSSPESGDSLVRLIARTLEASAGPIEALENVRIPDFSGFGPGGIPGGAGPPPLPGGTGIAGGVFDGRIPGGGMPPPLPPLPPGSGVISYFPPSGSLVVHHTPAVHQAVQLLLDNLRADKKKLPEPPIIFQ